MATRKKTPEPKGATPRRRGPAPKGLVQFICRLRPEQAAALRDEGWKRARDRGRGIPDASEVVREAIDAWMKGRG